MLINHLLKKKELKKLLFSMILKTPIWLVHLAANQSSVMSIPRLVHIFRLLDHLLGKVKKKIALLHPEPVLCGVHKELFAIPALRDTTSLCDIADNNDIVVLIELMMSVIWCACYVSFSFFCVCT